MHDFQWVVTESLLQSLGGKLVVTLVVLLVMIALIAVFTGIELRRNKKDDHEDS